MIIGIVAWVLGGSLPITAPSCLCLCMVPRLDAMVRLKPGDTATTVIVSRRVRDHTRIWVDRAGKYDVHAVGYWHDSTIRTDADGYRIRDAPLHGAVVALGAPILRERHARYFALIGQIGDDSDNRFVLGKDTTGWTPASSGELVTFANDVRFRYGNNRGCLALTVIRRS